MKKGFLGWFLWCAVILGWKKANLQETTQNPRASQKKTAKKRPTEKSKKHPKSDHKGIKRKEERKIKAKKGDSGQKLYQCVFDDIIRRAGGWRLAAGARRTATDRRDDGLLLLPRPPNRRRPYLPIAFFPTM